MISIVIVALAVYRLSLMIASEDGPFDLCLFFREGVILKEGTYHWFTRGVHCPLCVGFWLSFWGVWVGWVSGFIDLANIGTYIFYSLAVAGIQTFITLLAGIPGEEDE